MSLSPEQIPTPAALNERLQAKQAQLETKGRVLQFPEEAHVDFAEAVVTPDSDEQATTTTRRQATRPQGPPEQQSVNPVMTASAEQSIELPESAKPVVSTRGQGGASRPQGPATPEPSTSRSNGKLELADLVNVGKSGRAHVSGSYNSEGHSRNGQFLSKYETEQIQAHEEQIRKGLGQLAAERGLGDVDTRGRAHRENGQLMSNKELAVILGENKYVHPEQTVEEEAANDYELEQIVPDLGETEPAAAEPSAAIEPDAAQEEEASPVDTEEEAVRMTLKQRILRRLKHAGRQLYLAPVNAGNMLKKVGDYLNDEEKGRRRGIVAGVVGVAAVGGAVMAYKYGGDLFSHSTDVPPKAPTAPNQDLADLLSGRGGGTSGNHDQAVLDALQGNHAGGQEAVQAHLTLDRGGTIWDSLSQQGAEHGHNLSDAQLHDLTAQTLKANGLSWEEARQLPVGYQFNIPPEVAVELQNS